MKRQIFKAKFEEIEKPPRITPWRLLTYLVCETALKIGCNPHGI
jgi:hypothetical protein